MKKSLYYQSFGQGQAVILLHGLLGMSDNLLTLAKSLAKQYHVIVPDAVNHGQSPHQKTVSYASMADDVLQLMAELALNEAVVLGHSMGGKTAMQLALHHSDKVRALVVADIAPVAYPERYHPVLFQAMKQVNLAQISSRKEADKTLANHGVEGMAVRQFLLKNLRQDEQGQWFWRCGLDNIIANYSAVCAAPDLGAVYQKPSLFIQGGLSDYIQEKDKPIIRHYFPAAELFTLTGASHWLHAEYPEQFAARVNTFLAKLDSL